MTEMINRRLFCLLLIVMTFCGCTPDSENSSKTLIIRATLSDPITSSNALQSTSNTFALGGTYNAPGLIGSSPQAVGQNQIEILQTAASNTALWVQVVYTDQIGANFLTGIPIFECNTVTIEVIFDGQTIHSSQQIMGSTDGTCADGYIKNINLILP